MSNGPAFLLIGELSRRTGLATSALRYYERVALLTPDGRASGRRYYGPASGERIALIRLCQDAGFNLADLFVCSEWKSATALMEALDESQASRTRDLDRSTEAREVTD